MPQPIRDIIIRALADKLAAKRAEATIEALPHYGIWDSNDSDVGRSEYGDISVTTGITVESVHQADENPNNWSEQGNNLIAELIVKATGGDRTLGGLVDDISYIGATIYYPEPGSDVLGVDLNLEIKWRHAVGDPYSQS